MKTTLLAVAVAVVSLTSASAFADDCDHPGTIRAVPVNQPVPGARGHYETRQVQQWVEGRYENVYVAQQCHLQSNIRKPWKQKQICTPAHYTQRWVPGHYVTVTQQVWVQDFAPVPPPVRYGWGTQPTPPPAGPGFTVSFRGPSGGHGAIAVR
jgi:hypothetical protein